MIAVSAVIAMFAVFAVFAVAAVFAVFAVFAMIAVAAVFAVSAVFAMIAVFAMSAVFAMIAVFAVFAVYAVSAVIATFVFVNHVFMLALTAINAASFWVELIYQSNCSFERSRVCHIFLISTNQRSSLKVTPGCSQPRGGSAGKWNLYSYITSSSDIRYNKLCLCERSIYDLQFRRYDCTKLPMRTKTTKHG